MRRKDREVTSLEGIKSIIERCKVAHIAMVEDGFPYLIPMNFGYEMEGSKITLYFHCAKSGHKLEVLEKNPNTCVEMCSEGEPIYAHDTPCNSGYEYASLIGNGKAEILEDWEEKSKALTLLMERIVGQEHTFTKQQTDAVTVFKIVLDRYTAKEKVRK